MGKSPGRWIKTILFGKKSSKHSISRKGEKVLNAREVVVPARAPEVDPSLGSVAASQPNAGTYGHNEREKELEIKDAPNLPHDREVASVDDRDMAVQTDTTEEVPYDPEKIKEEMAATKAQAAFRGYLARRAFQALKGIIRLQALIRGHLVRRQAVATLCSMLGIVKLQALVRGRLVRQSEFTLEVRKIYTTGKPQGKLVDPVGVNLSKQMAKLSVNAFVRKLLASSPNVSPLRINYDPTEPNSVSMWLERWSASFFWKPCPQPKKLVKPQRKHQTLEAETQKSKRTIRRASASNTEILTTLSSSEVEKPKRNLRKVLNGSADPQQESPQNEIEKVKRSLRRVHNPVLENTVQSEVEDEKPRGSLEKPSIISSGDALLERSKSSHGEIMKKEAVMIPRDFLDAENTPEPIKRNDEVNLYFCDKSTEETKPSVENGVKDESTPLSNGTYECSNHKDDSSNGHVRISRKNSLTAKQEVAENGLQSTPSPTLPSYMAATESAKAKLRAQGSPRFGQDGSEKSNLSRRHSLPSSTNSLGHSPLPAQKAKLSGGKGGNKSDKREVPAKAEWRR
ncbi:protein IQ-DOMAIN 31-like [Punica granatum]|uniref:Protein IQ-DOMAIN 31-like n=2 Tax=Punica granatum TaxID=22663 RepID=A0A6P8EHX6_PUNGR|nr:protein IQ-DOMAIN 31-like [Punica granatum]XP_031405010.1 protein IQ-DOMAIN 31-like [Punica granatum]XP_031405011.1 protein IQ-DOMAIN 31-like [Punica granatum]PKI63224.1 hypothetical protein CRG98_016409 [Punica granatum]